MSLGVPGTAQFCLNNLGRVLRDLDDLPGARAAFERALAIWERVLGPEHRYTRRAWQPGEPRRRVTLAAGEPGRAHFRVIKRQK